MKIIFIRDIIENKTEPSKIIETIEDGINKILQQVDSDLKTIKINSSITVRDYDALTIRIIGFTA